MLVASARPLAHDAGTACTTALCMFANFHVLAGGRGRHDAERQPSPCEKFTTLARFFGALYALYGPITHCRGNGRPSIISTAIETAIMQQNRACPTLSLCKHVAKLANEHNVAVSYCTVRNVLNGNAIAAHSPAKKPALTARHIANRFT
ncbi:hypothetical protein PAPHI01_2772, partial [Pancytospora philotis]